MDRLVFRGSAGSIAIVSILVCSGAALHPEWGQVPVGWPGFAHNAHHWAAPRVAAQHLVNIKWSVPMDVAPFGGAHYGTPMLTRANHLVHAQRQANGSFIIYGRRTNDGGQIWSLNTGFVPPQTGWIPACGSTLTPSGGVAIPDSGGRVLYRNNADSPTSPTQSLVFYGSANYAANPAAYNANVKINTPIVCDRSGTLYFGFAVTGPTPINLQSGIARITRSGQGMWVSAATAANDPAVQRLPHNCCPALGLDESTLYVGARFSSGGGYLLCLNCTTLTLLHRVLLIDPQTGQDASLTDYSTSSPTIGPDGQVFYGVLDPSLQNNDRGWLLHFNATLTQNLTPGAFGWDNTVSIIPASSVGAYTGSSPYLLMSKYNNYYGIGTGDGKNKIAILDPNQSQVDPVSGIIIMKEVITKVGPTPDPFGGPGSVREWCINNSAVDAIGHAALVNNEDGKLYRWDLDTNTLSESVTLTAGTSEAYTPTVVGPDGTVYAINAATLYAVGQ